MSDKTPNFSAAVLVLIAFVATMFACLVFWESPPHIPMLLGCVISGSVAFLGGCPYREIERGMLNGIARALISVVILLLIGALIGVWIASGVVPAMIYYGLNIVTPRFFLPGAMILCGLVSMAVGSWGTAGTIGIALMGIAQIIGVSAPMAAGAIISGAYLGDKISPLSDSTNLASAVTGVDIFENVKKMLWVSVSTFLLAGAAFTLLGWRYGNGGQSKESIAPLLVQITDAFPIGPLNLLPLVLLVACVLLKVPSIPSIVAGILSAAVLSCAIKAASPREVAFSAFYGYLSHSGNEALDQLLSAGGIESMMFSVSLILTAMMFGGIMESTGLMRAFMAPLVERVRSDTGLVASTVASCIAVNVVLPEQYVAIAVPGQMFLEEYRRRGIPLTELTRALGAGGSSTSALVPWNTCGVFMAGVLGVSTMAYLPYNFANLLVPFMAVLASALSFRKKAAVSNPRR